MGRLKKYDEEFKKKAVSLVVDEGMKAKDVAEDLGIPAIYISQWKKETLGYNDNINGNDSEELKEAKKEIAQLKKELMITKEEREVLKKTVGFFAK